MRCERPQAVVETVAGTDLQTDAAFEHNTTHSCNHGLGEIVGALLDRGLRISGLAEHDSVPREAPAGRIEALGGGELRVADRPWRLAHSCTLQAVREAT